VVGQVPGGHLRRRLIDFAAAEHLADFGQLRIGAEGLERNDLVLHAGVGITLAVLQANGGDLHLVRLFRFDVEESAAAQAAAAKSTTTKAATESAAKTTTEGLVGAPLVVIEAAADIASPDAKL